MMRWQNVVIVGLLLAMAFGIHGAVDRARMNRDIRIMESVLGKLLAGEDRFDEEPNVSGMYFDGYGVLLLVERLRSGARMRRGYRTFGSSERVDEEISSLKERLVGFYADYAGKLQSLPDSERVTVRIEGVRGSDPFYDAFGGFSQDDPDEPVEEEESTGEREVNEDSGAVKHYGSDPARVQARIDEAMKRVHKAVARISPDVGGALPTLVATATRAEIKGGETGFVSFREHKLGSATDRSIGVMAGILAGSGGLGQRNAATGFYEPGLGAVYFVAHEPRDDFSAALDYYNAPQAESDSLKSPETGNESIVNVYTRQLVDLIGTYGGTLRPVKDEESIVAKVNFGRWGRFKGRPSGLIVQVKMTDVEGYQKGTLDLKGLMGAVLIEEL